MWILFAILFPTFTGAANILDKAIVDRCRSVPQYSYWIGIFELALGLITFGIVTGLDGVETRTVGLALGTGVLAACSLILFLSALRTGQVARVVPVWHLYPLIVAPLAAGFLGETLSSLATGAIFLSVAGAALVSWEKTRGGRPTGDVRVILLSLGAAALLAFSFVVAKVALDGGDFWQFFGSYRVGFAPIMFALAFSSAEARAGAPALLHDRPFMAMMFGVEVLITLALLTRFAAINLGDVALVAAVGAIQPVLVFFYSLGLASWRPAAFGHWITRGTLGPQALGIASITAAVVIISLQ